MHSEGIDFKIADARYTGPNSDLERIIIPGQRDNIFFNVEALDGSEFDFTVTQTLDAKTTTVTYLDDPITQTTVATVDVSKANPTYTIKIDNNGDGTIDYTNEPDSIETIGAESPVHNINPTPVEEWSRTFGGTGDDFAFAVQQTSDGGYIIAGVKSLKSDGDDVSGEAWLVKTDSNGNKQWDKTFGCTDGFRIALSVQQTRDGGHIFAGSNDAFEGWLVKTDSYGNTQWEKTFSTVAVMAAQQTSDGSYILAGVRTDSSDGWLMKIDPYGNTQWEKTFGGPGDDGLTAIQQTTDGGYILAGITDSYGAGASDFWLIKVKEGEAEISNGNAITNTIGMEFVLIPAGEFEMGSPSDEEYRDSDEGPVHHGNIETAFYMGRYEVTQKQWREVMSDNPSHFEGDDLPVETVFWDDVQDFITKLNEKEGTDKYRLPSEAEWEYAARVGTSTRYSFGDSESQLGDYAWYSSNSGSQTHLVGQKKANPWGLYDMHGSVWEWVQDSWHGNYDGAPADGSAWENGDGAGRVIRGGSWGNDAGCCRSARRGHGDPRIRVCILGFRILKEQ